MCYYNGQKVSKAEYIRLKHLEKLVANYDFLNVDLVQGFDFTNLAVCKPIAGKEDFDIVKMEWPFIPDKWFKIPIDTREKVDRFRRGYPDLLGNMESGITTQNAMAEELLLPWKIYRESALKRRVLIISTGFYEWRHFKRLNKRTGQPLKNAEKYPYFISLKDREYFFMAGIYKPWTDKTTGEVVETCSIVTTDAEKHNLMSQVHNSKMRMPTILNEDLSWEWMFGDLSEERILEIASTQYPSKEMQAWSIKKEFKESLCPADPFEYEGLPPLNLDEERGGTKENVGQPVLF